MAALKEEQLEEIRQFFTSPTATLLFERFEEGLVGDWMTATDLAGREQCWQRVQVLQQLHAILRDASAMKRLDQRAQERKAGTYTTSYERSI